MKMKIGTNTEFPSNIILPEALKVPEGNVFKFALYAIGVANYKFNASESIWNIGPGGDFYYVNDPKNLSFFNPKSIVARSTPVEFNESGKFLEGTLKSTIPGDTSQLAGKGIAAIENPHASTEDPRLDRWYLSQATNQGTGSFSDITYVQAVDSSEHCLPEGSYPDGYICSIPITMTNLFYKSV